MSGVCMLLSCGGRRLLTQKKVVALDVGGWLVTPAAAEGAGRYSRCADAAFVFSCRRG